MSFLIFGNKNELATIIKNEKEIDEIFSDFGFSHFLSDPLPYWHYKEDIRETEYNTEHVSNFLSEVKINMQGKHEELPDYLKPIERSLNSDSNLIKLQSYVYKNKEGQGILYRSPRIVFDRQGYYPMPANLKLPYYMAEITPFNEANSDLAKVFNFYRKFEKIEEKIKETTDVGGFRNDSLLFDVFRHDPRPRSTKYL